MEIEKIQMPKEKAKAEWKKYNELIKKRHEKYLEDMKKCMYQFKEGRELIDIYKVMEKAGVNKHYQPKLAIARADWKIVYFTKQDAGRGCFVGEENIDWVTKQNGGVSLQPHTFMEWLRNKDENGKDVSWDIANKKIKTKVPIVPSQIRPEGDLKDCYILWEVQQWENLPEQKDPILLKRITENLFVILGAWEVTALEQSIISGR